MEQEDLTGIPEVIKISLRIDEEVSDFARRIFVEAARSVGLPLQEQRIFAEALLVQYPQKLKRIWTADPTPSDKTDEIRKGDFGFLILRQYLTENAKMRGKKITVEQIKPLEGRITTDCTLDEITRTELAKWRRDFIYRGGQLGANLEAPITRQGLVPALQVPVGNADVTWVPRIMRSKSWNEGAALMEAWFSRPEKTRTTGIADTPTDYGPPVYDVIKMDWVLGFARAKTVYDSMITNKIWKNANAKPVVGRMLKRIGVVEQAKANPNRQIRFGDLNSANVAAIEKNQVQLGSVSETVPTMDGLTAALANFDFHLAIKGFAIYKSNAFEVTVEEIGIYVKDQYDFINDQKIKNFNLGCFCYDQTLGGEDVWGKDVGALSNNSFNKWREQNKRGGDFIVYSDIKITKLNPLDSFSVPI